jgi:uncharacterized protein YfaT (DUF1175 family)
MRRQHAVFYWLVPVAVLVSVLLAAAFVLRPAPAPIAISIDTPILPADGNSVATITVQSANKLDARIADGQHRAELIASRTVAGTQQFALRAGTTPGRVVVEISDANSSARTVTLETTLDPRDSAADGTPNFLRLDDPSDRRAFREWFTFLAEHEAFRPTPQLSPEINDCAALIRYAYRESLRNHDGTWATDLRLHEVPGAASVRKYQFPYTALGASIFRVKPGSFSPDDLHNGAFTQFADAHVLQSLNTHFVARDLRRAHPGDLLFFRQQDQRMPYHVMIFIGRSHFEKASPNAFPSFDPADNWLVYHTGPTGKLAGEIRRVTIAQLMRHPDPRWHPWADNPSFLGVYRWNILRDGND